MVLLSTLRQRCPSLNVSRLLKSNPLPGVMPKRHGGGHGSFEIKPSNFNFKKAKDLWHFYTCVAIVLYGPFILYANVFVGEATLIEIPEGYRPKYWEYYKHPISRWLEKGFGDPQKHHERFLHFLYEEDEKQKLGFLDKEVNRVMKRRKDYEAHYYLPLTVPANAIRDDKEVADRYKYHVIGTLSSSGFQNEVGDRDSDVAGEFTEFAQGVDE